MIHQFNEDQLSLKEFDMGFGPRLDAQNRWVQLAKFIPWDEISKVYAKKLSKGLGRRALSPRVALGSLIIKSRMKLSDRDTVEHIAMNPYLQYFLGYDSFLTKPPFDSSMMTHFRKRISLEDVSHIDEMIQERFREDHSDDEIEKSDDDVNEEDGSGGSDGISTVNFGRLSIDATVAPADITFPMDIKILNASREKCEAIIDKFHELHPDMKTKKPRTYRQEARKSYLNIAKSKRPSQSKLRSAIRSQLQYIRRDIGYINNYFEYRKEKGLLSWPFSHKLQKEWWVIQEVYRQQKEMFDSKSKSIPNRIVSLSQPHVRPIVRGKAGKNTEFGAKISVGMGNGYAHIDRLSWEAYSEGKDLRLHVEEYKRRLGYYPESVHADKAYSSRKNRAYLKKRNIRFSQKPLGRPRKETPKNRAELEQERRQRREDEAIRVEIEGKFGEGKRNYGLDCIMEKLAHTASTTIGIIFLVMNLERCLRLSFCHFFAAVFKILHVILVGSGLRAFSHPISDTDAIFCNARGHWKERLSPWCLAS